MEAAYGTFERDIAIREGIDFDQIETMYADGVLQVIVPAAAKLMEPPKARIIPIRTTRPVTAAKVA
jgi:HSP20 family molecular chaperone IbpA